MKPVQVDVAPTVGLLTPGRSPSTAVRVPASARPAAAAAPSPAPRPAGLPDRVSAGWEESLVVLVGGLVTAVAVTVLVATGVLHGLDHAAALPLHDRHGWVDPVGKITELPGQRAVGYPLALLALAALSRLRRDVRPLLGGLLAMLLVNLVVGAAKLAWSRPSPRRGGDGHLGLAWDGALGGYPSGHAANVAAIAVVLLLVTLRSGSSALRRTACTVSFAVVLVVCATSWLRSTHWVSDLVAGAAFGAVCGAAAVLLVTSGSMMLRWRREARPRSATASG